MLNFGGTEGTSGAVVATALADGDALTVADACNVAVGAAGAAADDVVGAAAGWHPAATSSEASVSRYMRPLVPHTTS